MNEESKNTDIEEISEPATPITDELEANDNEEDAGSPEEPCVPVPPPLKTEGPKKSRCKRFFHAVKTIFLLMLLTAGAAAGWHYKETWMEVVFPTAPLGVPYMVTDSLYSGSRISEDGADFTASFKIDIFEREGWKKIPLVPANVAIKSSKLPKGAHLYLADDMYCMLTRASGKIEVSVDYSVKSIENNGIYSLSFERVPSVSCTLTADFPVENLDVKADGAQSLEVTQTNDTTKLVAALPDKTPIHLSWEQALPKIEEGPSKYYSETKTLVSIHEGLILGQARVDFTILHTPTRELALNVPVGVSVLDVAGTQILDWRVSDGKLAVQLEKEMIGPYTLNIKYESPIKGLASDVSIPVITGSGVVREKGNVGVVSLSNLEVENNLVENAHAIDVKDLPAEITSMTSQPMLLAYRYTSPDFDIKLNISKHSDIDILLTIIDNAAFTVIQTHDGKRITKAVYNVRNNRNQFLRVALPKDAELWSASVAGRATQPAIDEDGRVLIPLVRSQGSSRASSFPVEIVYAEKGTAPDERGYGQAKIELPVCAEPIMHMMMSLYVPDAGKYFDFTGTMKQVDNFTPIAAAKPIHAIVRNNLPAQNRNQQVFVAQNRMQAPGSDPVEVRLPVSGTMLHFEKILVIKDTQWIQYNYKGLKM